LIQENDVTATAAVGDRAHVLDALRGLAIFGILLANMQHFTGWALLDSAARAALPLASANHVTEFLIAWFIDGKFYSLFSLLFGIGFAVMLTRAAGNGRDFRAYFRRRLSILLAIGLVHAVLIWYGDILTLYALLGFSLLWFRERSNAQLACWVGMAIAAAIFAAQLLACRLWLARFTFGPTEWLWRSLTLRRMQPLRRRMVVPARAGLVGAEPAV
jgi:uncharacterized protein